MLFIGRSPVCFSHKLHQVDYEEVPLGPSKSEAYKVIKK